MKIVSKFKDYYDLKNYALIDKNILYIRATKEIEKDFFVFGPSSGNGYGGTTYESGVIGFCGKCYPFYYITIHRYPDVEIVVYNMQSFMETVRRYDPERYKSLLAHDTTYANFFSKSNVAEFFNAKVFAQQEAYFHEYKVPVFVTINNRTDRWNKPPIIILNPCLKDYEFFKVKNPFSAFQEISMYISGVLGMVQQPVVEVSEAVKVAQHGFDKWSFRNYSPGTKKRKQRKAA